MLLNEIPLWFCIPCLGMLALLGYMAAGLPLF